MTAAAEPPANTIKSVCTSWDRNWAVNNKYHHCVENDHLIILKAN